MAKAAIKGEDNRFMISAGRIGAVLDSALLVPGREWERLLRERRFLIIFAATTLLILGRSVYDLNRRLEAGESAWPGAFIPAAAIATCAMAVLLGTRARRYIFPVMIVVMETVFVIANIFDPARMEFSNWTYFILYSVAFYTINDFLFRSRIATICNFVTACSTAYASWQLMRKAELLGEANIADNIGTLFYNSLLCLVALYFASAVKTRFVDALAQARVEVLALEAKQQSDALNAELREELTRMQRISIAEALSTSISHEVSQPMGSALASVQAASRWLAAPQPQVGEAIAAVTLAATQLERAGDILTALRALSVRKPQDISRHDLRKLIGGYLRLVEPDLALAGIECRLEFAGSQQLFAVEVRPTELGQVILNIVVNAMDALVESEGRKVIAILVREEEGFTTISISDNGPGIDHALRARVFERYFTTKQHGTGLGLTLCREIAGNNGWQLVLGEDGQAGAEFILQVPRAPRAAQT